MSSPVVRDEVAQLSSGNLKCQDVQGSSVRLKKQESIKWRVRPMRVDDIEKCLVIWRKVELTEAHQTVSSVLATDPDGFYVAELNSNGDIIGMCAGPMTSNDTAFMGFYAVEPKYQGIGVGRELWARTVGRLSSECNIGLYGVPAMSEKYKKSGFRLEDTIRMLIYESQPGQVLRLNLLKNLKDLEDEHDLHISIIDCKSSETLFAKLIQYDSSVVGFSREQLMRNYLQTIDCPLTVAVTRTRCSVTSNERKLSCCAKPSQEPPNEEEENLVSGVKGSLSISLMNDLTNEHKPESEQTTENESGLEILAYGCIRHDNTNGGMIGPIYANSGALCEIVLRELLERFKMESGGKYSVMSLTSLNEASRILDKIGLQEMDQCSRMFTKYVPSASLDKIFYVHSPNFSLF